jgi:hypothetical protein
MCREHLVSRAVRPRKPKQAKLELAGLVKIPGPRVVPLPCLPKEIQVAIAMQADRAEWVWRAGTLGWEAEKNRRRAARIQASRVKRATALWQAERKPAA